MNLSSSMILDIAVLAFIVIAAIVGAIKGLFQSIIGFAVIGVSIFAGYRLAPLVTPKAVEWVYPRISDKLLDLAAKRNIDLSLLNQEQTDSLLKSIMTPATRIVCWIIIAIICMILLGLVGTLVSKLIEKTPGVNGTNKLLGAVLGAFLAVLVCYMLVFGISKAGMGGVLAIKFEDSIAYKILYSLVPKSSDVIGINLPGIGEIDLKELFKGDVKQ